MIFLICAIPIALIVAVILADIRDYRHDRFMNRDIGRRRRHK